MALVTQAAGICVIAALLGLVLRRSSPEVTLLLALAAAAAVLLALGQPLGELLAFLDSLTAQAGVSAALFRPLYKIVGIALVIKVGGGLCRDAGESALAGRIRLALRLALLALAAPLMAEVFSGCVSLIG